MASLIRYTKYSKDLHSKEEKKKTRRHLHKKAETQEGGVNIRASFIASSLAIFSLFFFCFSSPGFWNFEFLAFLSSFVFL